MIYDTASRRDAALRFAKRQGDDDFLATIVRLTDGRFHGLGKFGEGVPRKEGTARARSPTPGRSPVRLFRKSFGILDHGFCNSQTLAGMVTNDVQIALSVAFPQPSQNAALAVWEGKAGREMPPGLTGT